jgi:hypothetical protein
MDWIFQFSESALIGQQSEPHGQITIFSAKELMPYYPK